MKKLLLLLLLLSPIANAGDLHEIGPGSPHDFYLDVAQGSVSGHTAFSKFGLNRDLDSASGYEIIAAWSGTWTPMSTASVLNVYSTSAEDSSNGNGARTVQIRGLDENRTLVSEILTLSGTTTATTANTYYGVNRVAVTSAGTTTYNVGNITVADDSSNKIQAFVAAGDAITQQMKFCVPSDKTAYVLRLIIDLERTTAGQNAEVNVKGYYQSLVGVRTNIFDTNFKTGGFQALDSKFVNPITLAGGGCWWFEADTDKDDTFIRGRLEQVLVNN